MLVITTEGIVKLGEAIAKGTSKNNEKTRTVAGAGESFHQTYLFGISFSV